MVSVRPTYRSSLWSQFGSIERQAAFEAARRSDPILIAHMRQAIDTMEASDNAHNMFDADRLFHQALLRATGNPALTFFADSLTGLLERDLKVRSDELRVAMGFSSLRRLLVIAIKRFMTL